MHVRARSETRTFPPGSSRGIAPVVRAAIRPPDAPRRERDAPFSDLGPHELELICARGVLRTYRKNTVLITEHEPGGALYVVHTGKVRVYVADENGKEFTMGVLGPGELFGELAIIDGGERSASVVAMEKSQIAVVSPADFAHCLATNPGLALCVIRRLASRVRTLTADVKTLALHDVYGRVARKLDELSVDRDGTRVIDSRPTQKEIASMVGASREMVSRIMKELVTGGYVAMEGHHMVIRRRLPPAW